MIKIIIQKKKFKKKERSKKIKQNGIPYQLDDYYAIPYCVHIVLNDAVPYLWVTCTAPSSGSMEHEQNYFNTKLTPVRLHLFIILTPDKCYI